MRASPSRAAHRDEAALRPADRVRNAIARIEILGEGSAGAVPLLDERGKRRRVGLVFGGTADQAQPLLAPTYYLTRALAPFADVREGRGGVGRRRSASCSTSRSRVLVLADVGALDRETLAQGSRTSSSAAACSLRFAGSRLAAGNDDLVPVRLRRGGRSSAARCPGIRRSTLRALHAGEPVLRSADAGRYRRPPPDSGRARRRSRRARPGRARRRHADRHRRQARQGPGRPLPCHRRHDLVEPAAVGPLRRHAAADRRRCRSAATRRSAEANAGRRRRVRAAPAHARRLRRLRVAARRRPAPSRATMPSAPRADTRRASTARPTRALAVNALGPGDRLTPLDFAPLAARDRAARRRRRPIDLRAPLLIRRAAALPRRYARRRSG